MLVIWCWRNWLRIRALCQPPLLSQNLQQRCLGAFLNRSFCHKKKKKKLLSQNQNSLQTKVDFYEPLDFKVFGGKVPLLTEHLLSAALVNRLENESECEGLITSDLACKKPQN